MTVTKAQIFAVLRSLPLIRFALMLGGGVVASVAAGHVQVWLLHARFPASEAVWLARINGAVLMGLGALMIIAVVMVALAFGRAGKLGVKAGGVELDIDFDNSEPSKEP